MYSYLRSTSKSYRYDISMSSAEFKYKVPNMYRLTLQYTRFPEQHRRYHHFSPNFSLPLANSTVNTPPPRPQRHKAFFHHLFEKRSPCSLAADDVMYRVRIVFSRRASKVKSNPPYVLFVGIYGTHCARTSMDDSSVSAKYRQGFASLWQ